MMTNAACPTSSVALDATAAALHVESGSLVDVLAEFDTICSRCPQHKACG